MRKVSLDMGTITPGTLDHQYSRQGATQLVLLLLWLFRLFFAIHSLGHVCFISRLHYCLEPFKLSCGTPARPIA